MKGINMYEILLKYSIDLRFIEGIHSESILTKVSTPNNNTRAIIASILSELYYSKLMK